MITSGKGSVRTERAREGRDGPFPEVCLGAGAANVRVANAVKERNLNIVRNNGNERGLRCKSEIRYDVEEREGGNNVVDVLCFYPLSFMRPRRQMCQVPPLFRPISVAICTGIRK